MYFVYCPARENLIGRQRLSEGLRALRSLRTTGSSLLTSRCEGSPRLLSEAMRFHFAAGAG